VKKTIFSLLFFVALAVDLCGILLSNREIQLVSKPVIVPALILMFLFQTYNQKSWLAKWILLALFFSWVGDVLLMFDGSDPLFFILGLSSFLIAHVFYIIFFHQLRVRQQIRSNAWLMVAVVIYYAALMYWLSPYLGDMALPVRIYGIVISFMLMLALHMSRSGDRASGRLLIAGAVLFVISDTLLAINKFYGAFEYAGVLIMITYGFAQYFLVNGALRIARTQSTGRDSLTA
jgi:uncharacterized membrane protein YhhN